MLFGSVEIAFMSNAPPVIVWLPQVLPSSQLYLIMFVLLKAKNHRKPLIQDKINKKTYSPAAATMIPPWSPISKIYGP